MRSAVALYDLASCTESCAVSSENTYDLKDPRLCPQLYANSGAGVWGMHTRVVQTANPKLYLFIWGAAQSSKSPPKKRNFSGLVLWPCDSLLRPDWTMLPAFESVSKCADVAAATSPSKLPTWIFDTQALGRSVSVTLIIHLLSAVEELDLNDCRCAFISALQAIKGSSTNSTT